MFSRQVGNESVRNTKVSLILPRQNSDADSVLIHHRDIALLREVRCTTAGNVNAQFPTQPDGSTDLSIQLIEKQPPIIVDGNGGLPLLSATPL